MELSSFLDKLRCYDTLICSHFAFPSQAKANPDLPCRAGALFRGVELFARLYMRMQKDRA